MQYYQRNQNVMHYFVKTVKKVGLLVTLITRQVFKGIEYVQDHHN